MKKNYIKYSILIGTGMILGVVASNISNVFGALAQTGQDEPSTQEVVTNTACIEYTTPSGTGIKCDDVIIQVNTGTVQGPEFFVQKRQKTGSMSNFTTGDVFVQSGEYIQYKVEFGSITGNCRNGTIRDILPSCVKYISSEIYGVTDSTFSTGNGYLQYTNFRLNGGSQGYILVTGQIIANTTNCENVTRYVNTGGFKCGSPSSDWMYSSVVARRQGGGGGGSGVVFTKLGNKPLMHLGESGLVFTLTVYNAGPSSISGIVINDIWPGSNNCIILDRWDGQNWQRSGDDYTWRYIGGKNGTLGPDKTGVLKLYASVANDSSCVGDYINTGVMTYNGGGPLYGYHPFVVNIDGPTYDDITITKTVDPQVVSHGQDIIYTIKYHNNSDKPLTEYTIKDTWPEGLQFKWANPQETSSGGNIIIWENLPPLQGNSTGTIRIKATVE